MQTTTTTSHHSVFYRPDALSHLLPFSFHFPWKEYMEKLMNEEKE